MPVRVGVIGAGVSGLLCAHRLLALSDQALQVSVFEWGRGPGGRTARRRAALPDGAPLSFDHAAPYFTATSSEFRGMLENLDAVQWSDAGANIWVGRGSNNQICRTLESHAPKRPA